MNNVVAICMIVEDFAMNRILLVDEPAKEITVHLPEIRMSGVSVEALESNLQSIYVMANDAISNLCGDMLLYESWAYIGKIVYDDGVCLVIHRFADLSQDELNMRSTDSLRGIISPSIYDVTFECFDNRSIKDPIILYKEFIRRHGIN